jgi:hypothetical protein
LGIGQPAGNVAIRAPGEQEQRKRVRQKQIRRQTGAPACYVELSVALLGLSFGPYSKLPCLLRRWLSMFDNYFGRIAADLIWRLVQFLDRRTVPEVATATSPVTTVPKRELVSFDGERPASEPATQPAGLAPARRPNASSAFRSPTAPR